MFLLDREDQDFLGTHRHRVPEQYLQTHRLLRLRLDLLVQWVFLEVVQLNL